MMFFGMMGGMFLFWILIVVLAVLLVGGLFKTNQSGTTNQPMSARQILEQRYARGEINREQYRLMLKDLE